MKQQLEGRHDDAYWKVTVKGSDGKEQYRGMRSFPDRARTAEHVRQMLEGENKNPDAIDQFTLVNIEATTQDEFIDFMTDLQKKSKATAPVASGDTRGPMPVTTAQAQPEPEPNP